MTFTDDDLKRLKEIHIPKIQAVTLSYDKFFALLDRLEAAERCLVPSTDYCLVCYCEDCESKREAWRKAAGKGEGK
jgi:hypothetical protein